VPPLASNVVMGKSKILNQRETFGLPRNQIGWSFLYVDNRTAYDPPED